jgi:hypothetical protein
METRRGSSWTRCVGIRCLFHCMLFCYNIFKDGDMERVKLDPVGGVQVFR